MEVGNFDVALLNNPNLKIDKSGYQKGLLYGYENIKSYVRTRDKYTCQHCKKKKSKLEVHHIIFRSNGGSDKPENLITLCHECHSDLHKGKWNLDKIGKRRGSDPFATQMNSIRIQLQKTYPDAEYVYGYKTKVDRLSLGIEKDHCNDAVVIASQGRRVCWKNKSVIYKKCISKGEYQLYKGIRSEKKITREKIAGFRRYDKVAYLGRILYISGRRKSGTCDLVDIFGEKQDYSFRGKGKKTPKLKECKRISGRKTWLIQTVDKKKGGWWAFLPYPKGLGVS